MLHSHEELRSWLGVHRQESVVLPCESLDQLERIVEVCPEARAIGKNHSYNRSALHRLAVRLGGAFDFVTPLGGGRFSVGAAATIEKVMVTLMAHGLRLPNSGNHRQQTFVGACVGGTHGFGARATMMDAVLQVAKVGEIIWAVEIEAVPARRFEVTHCVCPLGKLVVQAKNAARSYAVLPYSGREPMAIVSEYRPYGAKVVDGKRVNVRKPKRKIWWRVRALQAVQRCLPGLHRCAQRLLNFAKLKTWTSITSPHDIDALYHPWPEVDAGPVRGSRWVYWSQRPTYQYYNVAMSVPPEQSTKLIRRAIELSGRKLVGFIGVREMTDRSSYERALNFGGARNAIDLYFYPADAERAHWVQRVLAEEFGELRLHPSKSVGEDA